MRFDTKPKNTEGGIQNDTKLIRYIKKEKILHGTKHLRKLTPKAPTQKAQQGVSVRKCNRSVKEKKSKK